MNKEVIKRINFNKHLLLKYYNNKGYNMEKMKKFGVFHAFEFSYSEKYFIKHILSIIYKDVVEEIDKIFPLNNSVIDIKTYFYANLILNNMNLSFNTSMIFNYASNVEFNNYFESFKNSKVEFEKFCKRCNLFYSGYCLYLYKECDE